MANIKVPVADRFVPAKHDDWGERRGPAKAFVIHMAEGNNVWRYLAYGNVARSVSVHFTVEADGEIVQMMNLSRISGSINPTTLRKDEDDNGHYGYTHARKALGEWWDNPNNAVITVEVAGKAVDGPNEQQVTSIDKLFKYLVSKYPTIIPLGHRDFQNVKPCPGNKMFWTGFKEIGGHGNDYVKEGSDPTPAATDGKDIMIITQGEVKRTSNYTVKLPKGTPVFEKVGDKTPLFSTTVGADYEFYGYTRDPKDWWAVEVKAPAKVFSDGKARPVIAYVKENATIKVVEKPVVAPEPPIDVAALQAEVDRLTGQVEGMAETARQQAVKAQGVVVAAENLVEVAKELSA